MSHYSPDQVPEPEIGAEPCEICGEAYECDEAIHRVYDEECGGSCGDSRCEYRCRALGSTAALEYMAEVRAFKAWVKEWMPRKEGEQ